MNAAWKLMLVGPVALCCWSCGHAGDHEHADDDPAVTAADDGPSGTTQVAPSNTAPTGAADPGPAGGSGPDGANPDPSEFDVSLLETPDSALRWWVARMAEGDYYGVLLASDSGSSYYKTISNMAEALERAAESDDEKQRMVTNLLRLAFNDPWIDATIEQIEMNENRARFIVTWTNEREIPVDLTQIDGVWRVLVTEQMLQPDSSAIDPNAGMPAPSNTARQGG